MTFLSPAKTNDHKRKNEALFEPTSLPLSVFFPFKWIIRWIRFRIFKLCWNPKAQAKLILSGICYGEGPRIKLQNRDNNQYLYFSDMHKKEVLKLDLKTDQVVNRFTFRDSVSGLGFLPNNKLLVVLMSEQKLVLFDEENEKTNEYADLSNVTRHLCNDMVVDTKGNAYVGNFGFCYTGLKSFWKTTIVRVDASDQSVHVASKQMFFPNGCVVTPDNKMLIVAETFSSTLTAFDIDNKSGELVNRRIWADLQGMPLDGICLDAEGCIWVAIPQLGPYSTSGCIVRVQEGGKVLECFGFNCNGLQSCPIACNLTTDKNGEHFLYILEAEAHEEHLAKKLWTKNGRLKKIQVSVGPAKSSLSSTYNAGYC